MVRYFSPFDYSILIGLQDRVSMKIRDKIQASTFMTKYSKINLQMAIALYHKSFQKI